MSDSTRTGVPIEVCHPCWYAAPSPQYLAAQLTVFFLPAQSRVAEHLTKNIDRAFTTALNVVYFPQLGYLCAVPLPQGEDAFADERLEATPHGWLYQFTTEVSIYYKNQEMHDLDIHLGDVHGYIVDREVELVQDMLLKVLDVQEVLCQCADSLAELDVLLAFAEAGRQCEFRIPRLPRGDFR